MSGNLVAGDSVVRESLTTEATRRQLTARQADTVRRLTEAGCRRSRATGYENLSIRDVARRAGVAAATAYTYFASKDHLLTEIFWRRLNVAAAGREGPAAEPGLASSPCCASSALLVSEEPELAAGCTAAMFGASPTSASCDSRSASGSTSGSRRSPVRTAPRPRLLELAYFGAMVEAGLGYTTYGHMADRLAEAVELIMG